MNDKLCRYCGAAGATLATLAYWNQVPDLCHPECKKEGERQEAIDCQSIDADCNDCRNYKRGQLAPKVVSLTKTKKGETVEVTFQPNIIIRGRCLKFDKPTTAYPHAWTGKECFEHRKLAA